MTDQTNAQGHDHHAAQGDAGPPLSIQSPQAEHEAGQAHAEPVETVAAPEAAPHAGDPAAEAGSGDAENAHVGPAELAAQVEGEPSEVREEPFETADEPKSGAARTIEAEPAKRKSSLLIPIASLVGVALVGGGGYVSWRQYEASQGRGPGIFEPAQPEAPASEPVKTDAGNPETVKPAQANADNGNSDAGKTEATPAASAPSDVKTDEAKSNAGKAEPAGASSPAAASSEPKSSAGTSSVTAESGAKDEAAKSEPAAAAASLSPAERDLNDRLAQTQTQLNLVQKRLAAAEARLTAPKAEAVPARASDAAGRLVLAQSVATALRQDADASVLIGALEKLGADPENVEKLRAGLSAPNLTKLAAEFSGLSDRIIAAAAPSAPANTAEAAPKSLGGKALAFLKSRAEKLVKVRAVGSLQDQAAGHVAQATKDLNAGDLAGALAEQAQLPEPARAVSADWAKAAQARLDAEQAAKAEVEAALQNLSKSKT